MRYCEEMDSKLCTRRMVSANIFATEMIVALGQFLLKGMELVKIISTSPQFCTRSEAGFDVADNCHRGHYVGFGALFVAEHQGHVEVFRVGVGSLGAAYVGSGYYEVLEVEALYVGDEYGRGVEVVNGNIEESLNLVGVEVHGDYAVYSGGLEEVADEFCRD